MIIIITIIIDDLVVVRWTMSARTKANPGKGGGGEREREVRQTERGRRETGRGRERGGRGSVVSTLLLTRTVSQLCTAGQIGKALSRRDITIVGACLL